MSIANIAARMEVLADQYGTSRRDEPDLWEVGGLLVEALTEVMVNDSTRLEIARLIRAYERVA